MTPAQKNLLQCIILETAAGDDFTNVSNDFSDLVKFLISQGECFNTFGLNILTQERKLIIYRGESGVYEIRASEKHSGTNGKFYIPIKAIFDQNGFRIYDNAEDNT